MDNHTKLIMFNSCDTGQNCFFKSWFFPTLNCCHTCLYSLHVTQAYRPTYEVSCHILRHSQRSCILTTWFGFDIAEYFNLWCRRMFRFGCQQYMFTLHVVDHITFHISLIYGEYLVNVHFSDIPHAFIPHYPSFQRKNLHRIFCKLPLDNFPHSTFCIPQNAPSPFWALTSDYVQCPWELETM